jgi:NAD(P)H dehydrogenase (quinone)
MAKVLVLYYSSYGYIKRMAHAEAEGARSAGADVDVKRVPELLPDKIALAAHYKLDQIAPIARIDQLTTTMPLSSALRRASETWRRR